MLVAPRFDIAKPCKPVVAQCYYGLAFFHFCRNIRVRTPRNTRSAIFGRCSHCVKNGIDKPLVRGISNHYLYLFFHLGRVIYILASVSFRLRNTLSRSHPSLTTINIVSSPAMVPSISSIFPLSMLYAIELA